MTTILIFLIVIILLVFIHELGHFFAAKSFGVRVDEFGIGYPPRAGKLFTWRGTLFSLNWLPFGGFVKIFGEDSDTETPDPNSFVHQKMWKRALILVAGILANVILAVVLYSISFGVGFLASAGDFPGSTVIGPQKMLVTDVVKDSPASKAGIVGGDTITKMSTAVDSIVPQKVDETIAYIQLHGTEPLTISVLHKNTQHDVVVTPKIGVVSAKPGIGIGLAEVATVRLPFFLAIKQGFIYSGQQFVGIIKGLRSLVSGAVHGQKGTLSQVSGPVGIAQIAGQAYALGFGSFLAFVALISLNLAVINLLPFPALDGGRLLLELFTVEGRSRIPKRVVNGINQAGFILLILLMLYVTYHDIARLIA